MLIRINNFAEYAQIEQSKIYDEIKVQRVSFRYSAYIFFDAGQVVNITGVQCRCPSAGTDNDRRCKRVSRWYRGDMTPAHVYEVSATSYAVYGRPLPARTGYTIRVPRYVWTYSSQRANIIRVTSPRRYNAEDLRRRNLVTMSRRVRDGTSPASVTLRNIRM